MSDLELCSTECKEQSAEKEHNSISGNNRFAEEKYSFTDRKGRFNKKKYSPVDKEGRFNREISVIDYYI